MHSQLCWFINTSPELLSHSGWDLSGTGFFFFFGIFCGSNNHVHTTGSSPTVGDPEWLTELGFDLELCRKQNNHTARSQSAKKKKEEKDFSVTSGKNPLEFWHPWFVLVKNIPGVLPCAVMSILLPLAKLFGSQSGQKKKGILLQNPTQSLHTLCPLPFFFLGFCLNCADFDR